MKEKKEKEIKKADSSYDPTSFKIEGKPSIDGQYINVREFIKYLPLDLRGFLVFEKVTGFFFFTTFITEIRLRTFQVSIISTTIAKILLLEQN